MSTASLSSYKRVTGYSLSLYPLTLFLHTKLPPDMTTWQHVVNGNCRCGCRREWGWCFGACQTTCKNVESKNKGDCFCLAKQNNIFFLDIRAGLWYIASLTVSEATIGCNVKHVKQFVHSWWPTKNLLVSLTRLFPLTVIWIFYVFSLSSSSLLSNSWTNSRLSIQVSVHVVLSSTTVHTVKTKC